jgi:hypothetical protein
MVQAYKYTFVAQAKSLSHRLFITAKTKMAAEAAIFIKYEVLMGQAASASSLPP